VLTPYVRGFIRASLVWLAIGILIGVAMAFWPAGHIVYRPAHAHANLLGFVSMFIFGVAYHVLPRFVGRPLPNEPLAMWHLWIANLGLALLVSGWLAGPTWMEAGRFLLIAGATLSLIGAALFIVNAWRITSRRSNVELGPPAGR
jgi:cbb3-type cytochrome oxidase subunit 1